MSDIIKTLDEIDEIVKDGKKPYLQYPGIATRLLDEILKKTESYLSLYSFYEMGKENFEEEIEFIKEKIIDAYQLGWRVGYSFHKEQEEGKL